MNGFAAYNAVAGVQLAAYAAVGLRENLISMAAISLFPPGSLYRSPALTTVEKLLSTPTPTPTPTPSPNPDHTPYPNPTLALTTRVCAFLTVTSGTARSATRGGSRAPRTSRRCVAAGQGVGRVGCGMGHGARGTGHGAWGMGIVH